MGIVATQVKTIADNTAIISSKNDEIAALKRKPKFLTRVKHVAEAVGIGIGIGFLLAK